MKRNSLLSEDYTAVVLAFFIILISILGFRPTLPAFSWKTASDFLTLISDSQLWINLFVLWGFGYVILLFAILLTGHEITIKSLGGYSLIFFIAIISQMFTGNSEVKSLGLEIVLFSLLIGLFISNVLRLPEWVKPAIQ